ncbi:hypothetical protein HR45_10050 [Shewanella mangrovi]|uniref:DUF1456 family protein n=1 Tax=Shewanella mangrovi TaxID=1515746 RepID=A0A094JDU2_9GAMM|nr:DUF1456 family protein [Shewanella mangrovi]KFZ37357.1 hypothetical protein HR45_10050 [Shewanella mangrovi]
MTNNDILRRLRFALNIHDSKMIRMFARVHREMEPELLLALMKKEDEEDYRPCDNRTLCQFLDALIIEKRGMKPGAGVPQPTNELNNNIILKKIRIALQYKEEDFIEMLALANFRLSKSELSALFRNPDQKNYRYCGDQVMRNFLKGLSIKLRGK